MIVFTNIYFGNYDILYCCNLVFNDNDNNILYNKIETEFKGIFILFDYNNNLEKYFIDHKIVKTNWNKKQNIFVFETTEKGYFMFSFNIIMIHRISCCEILEIPVTISSRSELMV